MANEKTLTKAAALREYVLDRYGYSRDNTSDRRGNWTEYYEDFRGTRSATKDPWQANYIIPALKDALRTKIPLYLNIMFAGGIKSFDILPGDPDDELVVPLLRDILAWQLECVGERRNGLFVAIEAFLKQFEVYGYSVAKIPWRKHHDQRGKVIYEGPDLEVIDVFNFFPDPAVLDATSSWVITRKRDVFASTLRRLEQDGIYHSVSDLKDTTQPASEDDREPTGSRRDNLVELLEYHGEVPKDLLEGKITDESTVSPYEDEYTWAIVTVANQEVVIRADEYPYKAGNIFVDAAKDRMPNEKFGVGTAEDIQAMAEELTNAHNKLTDCVNIITNPQMALNPSRVVGATSGNLVTYPGKVWIVNGDNVANAIQWMNTAPQAASLQPILALINELENKIQKITQAVPVISPAVDKAGLPNTLGATLMMQGNAAEPIKSIVKHTLEPWFVRVLEIFYKHDLQFFTKSAAYRVLGEERAHKWLENRHEKEIAKKDISLKGNPDFVPRGVTVFAEKQAEVEALVNFLTVAQQALEPVTDPMGQPVAGPDGQPAMKPLVDQREIIKRIAIKAGFEDLEKLIPSLRDDRENRERQIEMTQRLEQMQQGQGSPAPQQGMGQELLEGTMTAQ